jgi:rare lipoprotein A
MMKWRLPAALACLLTLGCSSRGEAPSLVSAPLPSAEAPPPKPAPRQIGRASWYGPYHHGRKTANGEIYDMNALTAAHRTLPLGTRVRVTNLQNGRTVVVRLNDRGPYIDGRIIDLSRKAAQVLGMVEKGLAEVSIEVLTSPPERKTS